MGRYPDDPQRIRVLGRGCPSADDGADDDIGDVEQCNAHLHCDSVRLLLQNSRDQLLEATQGE